MGQAADGDDGFDERPARNGHAAQAPHIVQAHNAHAFGIFPAGHGLDQQGVHAGRVVGRHMHDLGIIMLDADFLGHGQQDAFGRRKAAQHFQALVQIALMGQQHGFGPGDAGVGIETVDDEGFAVLPQGLGVEAQVLENGDQVGAPFRQGQQVHMAHLMGGGTQIVVRLHGFQKDGALVDVRNAAEHGRKEVALVGRGMLGQQLVGVDQAFLAQSLDNGEALAVETHLTRAGTFAETLGDAVDQVEARVTQHLKHFLHDRLTWYGTGRTGIFQTAPCPASDDIPCTARGRHPCGPE